MADRSALETALRNADAAGDTAAAKTIAGELWKMQSAYRTPAPPPGYNSNGRPVPGVAEGMARSALQGATYGAGDEIVAAGASLVPRGGSTMGERYSAYVGQERERNKEFQTEHPVLATGAELAGSIPTSIGATGALGRGAQALGATRAVTAAAQQFPRLAATATNPFVASAATGATEAGLYGFNAGEGGVGDRLKSAAVPAALGGAFGAAAPAVAGGAANWARSTQAQRLAQRLGMGRPASDVLRRTLQADDSLSPAGEARVRTGGMLADAGPSARGVLDTVVQSSGPGGRVAREAIENRTHQSNERITGALDRALGTTGADVPQYGAEVSPLYERAYATPIDYANPIGQRVEQTVRTRVPQAAITKANALMRAEGDGSRQILIDVGDDGNVTFRQMPDVRQLDYITRGLNDVASEANGRGVIGGQTNEGRIYGNLSGELRRDMRQLVPAYGEALDSAGGYIREGNAQQLGSTVLNPRTTRAEIDEAMQGMGAAEQRRVSEGVRQYIDDAVANVTRTQADPNVDARESVAVLKAMSSRANREKVAYIIGDVAADDLFRELDQAAQTFELRAATSQNSKTFARQSLNDTMKSATDDGVINAVRNGQFISKQGAVARAAQLLMGRASADKQRIYDATQEELAGALTGPNGLRIIRELRGSAAAPERSADHARRMATLLARAAGGASAATTTK